jgi:hypothetical protein
LAIYARSSLSRPIIFPSPKIALYGYLKFDVDFDREMGGWEDRENA